MSFLKDFMKKGGENEPEEGDRKIEQEDIYLEISREMAGVIFALEQLVKSEEMKFDRAINLLRIFFEADTGEMLKANHIKSLLCHKLVYEYVDRVGPNFEKRKERLSKFDFADGPEDIAQEEPRWKQREARSEGESQGNQN